jgi:hypothetical protein
MRAPGLFIFLKKVPEVFSQFTTFTDLLALSALALIGRIVCSTNMGPRIRNLQRRDHPSLK